MIQNDHSQDAINALNAAKTRALEMIGLKCEGYAKIELDNDPRRIDTGRLRNSITHKTDKDKVHIGTNVYYGKYVQFGTYKMRANEFLKNAVEKNMNEFKSIVENELKRG